MTDPGDSKLRDYSRRMERLDLILDRNLASIRARQRDGLLIPLDAAHERQDVLLQHLATQQALYTKFWGQDDPGHPSPR